MQLLSPAQLALGRDEEQGLVVVRSAAGTQLIDIGLTPDEADQFAAGLIDGAREIRTGISVPREQLVIVGNGTHPNRAERRRQSRR